MESLLEELWYGNIQPLEKGYYGSAQLKEESRRIAKSLVEFEEVLTDEQKQQLDRFLDARGRYDSLAEKASFCLGFRLGARIMMEVLAEE